MAKLTIQNYKDSKIFIFGGGSSCQNIIELIEDLNFEFQEIVIVDDYLFKKNKKKIGNLKIIKSSNVEKNNLNFGICSIANPQIRKKINSDIKNFYNLRPITLVHHDTKISKNVKIGKGVIIFSGVRINHNTKIGDGSLINFNVDIGHDVKIGSNTVILTNSLLLGNVIIGSQVLIGAGC